VRLNKLFEELHRRTGIQAHPHLFRHTFATRLLQMGYPYVQQLLGHRSSSTAKDIYSHVLDEMSLESFMDGKEEQ
jgi:integrase